MGARARFAAAAALKPTLSEACACISSRQGITRSTGQNLHIETTSLAVLALKAMTAYANASRKTKRAGKITLFVNGKKAGEGARAAGRRGPVVVKNFGEYLTTGVNVIELEQDGEDGLPYSLAVEYRSAASASSPDAVVTNRTDKGQPMTLARIGIPGGLSFQPWQLKDLREKGLVPHGEASATRVLGDAGARGDRVLPGPEARRTKTIPIDLVATAPGTYTAPASSAYLYDSDDLKTWAPETKIEITR